MDGEPGVDPGSPSISFQGIGLAATSRPRPAAPGLPWGWCPRPPPMPHQLVVDLARNAILMALLLAGPMLVVALGVGLIVSVIQAVTQIQEQTLAFVPKLVAVSAAFLVGLPWGLQLMSKYTTELYRSLPSFVR